MSIEKRVNDYYFKHLLRFADPTGLSNAAIYVQSLTTIQPSDLERRKQMYGITESDPTEIAFRIFEEELKRSPEAITRKQEAIFFQQKSQILANNEFDLKTYMELNPDIKQVFLKDYGFGNADGTFRDVDSSSIEALNHYATRHWVDYGHAEGRKYKIEAPVPEAVLPTNPMDSLSGGGGGFSFRMPSAPALNTASYDALAAQVNNAIGALNRPAATSTNKDLSLDISAAPSITQGTPFELLTSSRFSRGLNPYVGTEKKQKTYFESIGLV